MSSTKIRDEILQHAAERGDRWQGEIDENIEHTLKAAVLVPMGLRDALDCNPFMAAVFYKILPEAVRLSFLHPDGQMRVVTASAVEQRTEMALNALDSMYNNHGMSLRQAFDRLLPVMIEALRQSKRPDDIVSTSERAGRWHRDVPVSKRAQ